MVRIQKNKSKPFAMKTFYKNDIFSWYAKGWENTTTILTQETFNDLQVLMTRLNDTKKT